MRRLVLAVAVLAAGSLAVPLPAEAKTVRTHWQLAAYAAPKVADHIGFIPINDIQPPGTASRYRAGKTTYVVAWTNAIVAGYPVRKALKAAARYVKYGPVDDGVFTDRFLTRKEKRSWQVLADLARDADVLVVHPDNPVCQTGLKLSQARGIAQGKITRWSQVTALPPGQPDEIRRRLVGRPGKKGDAFAEPRFGAKALSPHTVIDGDGGLSEVGSDRRVAAVTSYSRARWSGGCKVAINGVAPTGAAVHGLRYPAAYPMQFVMHRKRPKRKESRVMAREYVRFMKSEKAAERLRNTGLLLAADPAPAEEVPGPAVGPGPGGMVRDDAAASAALSGQRLASGPLRLAFDPGGVLIERYEEGEGTCSTTSGSWAVLEGFRDEQGGVLARVQMDLGAGPAEATIELPADAPGTAYLDGQPWARDASLPAGCA